MAFEIDLLYLYISEEQGKQNLNLNTNKILVFIVSAAYFPPFPYICGYMNARIFSSWIILKLLFGT